MIFVTVGNFIPFPRLTGAIEDLKRRGMIRDKVFMQVANERRASTEDCHVEQFLTPSEFAARLREADVVVTHGGYGTIIEALRLGKVPVVMPRRRKYQEHVDDHQVDLAEELALQKRIVLVHEVTELHSAIIEAQSRKAESATPEPLLAKLVAKAIDELLAAG